MFKSVESNYSFNSTDRVSELFQVMFHDSSITKNYQMQSIKLAYICNFDIAPYIKDISVRKVQESSFYAFSFDESFS